MLQATPRSIFSWGYTIRQGSKVVAEVDPAWFGERADVTVAGEPYTLTRDSILEGTFSMRSGGQVVARARKPNPFTRAFEVDIAGRYFELRAVSIWRREFGLFEDRSFLGRIAPASWFGRSAVIDLPAELPPSVQVFLFWLVFVMWRRAGNSSGAAAAGS